ncbi:Uncharacterised protein [Mycobacteroides abscessus subsp. abscessus]|uniref:Uncharacterized protein n=2 Tax=Mycobacteroides abscessus TaxID=36809 RepID=A0A9Q7SHP3_9MYCO|nr:hypothetical protein [Mycobacteroides abscessus]SKG53569.1 Uncharacterised protein [Mycobacteroides abscessus subsp. massiliense]SHU55399.1 Uncharacterised protein [Mycobacteroides abscessus subsp. bolletii]SHU73590.1 Uncharacterised protein [Mycobacteroides abscessus subsp. bolletii]SHX83548.1 Uncharacterised protein [Mycobacteroides abscessus subsp. bolletii]SID82493.1 Uncharacterised protein [Mycobacteroides abscessus subsp. abscessus]
MYTQKQSEAIQAAYGRAAERRVALDAEFMCIEATDWVNRPTAHEEFMSAMDEHHRLQRASNAQLDFEIDLAMGKYDLLSGLGRVQ